jgi:hypothetical protein
MATYYVTEELALAPGIAGEWPYTISKPDNPNGRLVRLNDEECKKIKDVLQDTSVYLKVEANALRGLKFLVDYGILGGVTMQLNDQGKADVEAANALIQSTQEKAFDHKCYTYKGGAT